MEHDSLEDYLRISEKKGEDGNGYVKGILTAAQKRKECERKALGIVQLLLERSVNADLFLKSIVYLNPSYYEDISEERALLQLCGYPLCRKRNSKPKYRYKISNKSKKVYDLDEYGNFCSTFCFDANNHIKSQLLDSPLWLRDLEDMPTFTLFAKNNSRSHVGGVDIQSKKVKTNAEFTAISSFAELSLGDVENIEFSVSALDDNKKHHVNGKVVKKVKETKLSTVMENIVEESGSVDDKGETNSTCSPSKSNFDHLEPDKVIKEKINSERSNTVQSKELKMQKADQTNQKKNVNKKVPPNPRDLKSITNKIRNKIQKPSVTVIDALPIKAKSSEVLQFTENHVEIKNESMNNKSLIELKFSLLDSSATENTLRTVLEEWITLDTLVFIHGEDKIKNILDENKLSEHFDKLKISQLEIDQQNKYISICRRLCEEEIFEEKIETLFMKNNLRPVPDYKKLKSESKEFDLKVRTFLSGDMHESDVKNFGPSKTVKIEHAEEPTFIPLVGNDSQNALRQKILSDTLNKSIQFLLDYINYDSTDILTEIKNLIKTFKLNAKNIVFKPVVRNYLGFICLKIISLKDEALCKEIEKNDFRELENSIFEQFPGKKTVLVDTLKLIEGVDNFLETYIIRKD